MTGQRTSLARRARAQRPYSAAALTGLFFTFSFAGWLWEVALHLLLDGVLVKRGALLGPWLPVYGVGGVLAVVLLRRWAHRPGAVLALGTALCTLLEYATGKALLALYGLRWWDYSLFPLNVDGLVSPLTSLLFGLGCCAAVYLAAPALAARFDRLRPHRAGVLCALLLTVFMLDCGCSAARPNTGAGVTVLAPAQLDLLPASLP